MIQERLAAAQGYLQRNDNVAATAQCEEVLRVDAANAQAQRILSQIGGQMQPSGPLPQGAGGCIHRQLLMRRIGLLLAICLQAL